jgi:hypothetical protein
LLHIFTAQGALLILGDLIPGVMYFFIMLNGQEGSHIPSVYLAPVLWILVFQVSSLGLVIHLMVFTRRSMEERLDHVIVGTLIMCLNRSFNKERMAFYQIAI